MSNLRDLKLNDVEVLNDINSMSTTSSSGNSGDLDASGSGRWWPCNTCPEHECNRDGDCNEYYDGYGACYKVSCGWDNVCTYRKCRSMDDNEKSCVGKQPLDACRLYGNPYTHQGWCKSYLGSRLSCQSNPW